MNGKAEPISACLSNPAAEQMLVAAARHGDEQACETLFKCHRQQIMRVVLRYARVREDAEDIVQQSFHKAFMYLRRFEGKSSFSTWLTRIAINEALMFLRSSGAVRLVHMDEGGDTKTIADSLTISDTRPDPEANCLQRERVRLMLSALRGLRPRLRQALELRELAEFSTEQTAEQMGLSVGAVKARLFHGRKQLRERVRRYMKSPRALERGSSRHCGAARTSRGILASAVSA